jgi:hypothetical protein
MLLPALGKARATARQIKCLGNLRQIGSASAIYADDYDFYAPYKKEWHWKGGLAEYLGIEKTVADYKKYSILMCPELMDKTIVDYACGYRINYEITRNGSSGGSVSLNQINNPSVMSLYICSNGESYGYTRYYIRGGLFGRYHPNCKTCVDYIDGHVDSRKVITGNGGDYSTNWEWFVVAPFNDFWWE